MLKNWLGKIIGGFIGAVVGSGSPILIALGVFLGHLYDQKKLLDRKRRTAGFGNFGADTAQAYSKIQQIFFDSSFQVMGHIAKSDGRVSEREIQLAQQVMQRMGLSEARKREAIRLFNQGKRAQFDLAVVLRRLRQVAWFRPSLLKVFLEMQVQMAKADGLGLTTQKRQTLYEIYRHLGIGQFDFGQFEQQYRTYRDYQQGYHSNSHQQRSGHQRSGQNHRGHSLTEAYAQLGISSSATAEEIKKAYRRLMSQHHPDKLIAKGLPPEMIKMATQKTQQIKQAYEHIRQARGF